MMLLALWVVSPHKPIVAPTETLGTVTEVVHFLRGGGMEAWNGAGKRIAKVKDPIAGQPDSGMGRMLVTPANYETYRVVLNFNRNLDGVWWTGNHRRKPPDSVVADEFSSSYKNGCRKVVTVKAPPDELTTTIYYRIATGPYTTYFAKTLRSVLVLSHPFGFTYDNKPADVWTVTVPYVDPAVWSTQGAARYSDGTSMLIMPMPRRLLSAMDLQDVVVQLLGNSRHQPKSIKLEKCRWLHLAIGPIPLRATN